MATVETAKDRRRLARQAGFGSTSLPSVAAGTLVALGLVALVMVTFGAGGSRWGLNTDGINTQEWRTSGAGGVAGAAGTIFIAFLFGGYTAGRMSRRFGIWHGLLVFVLAALVVAAVAAIAHWGDDATLSDSAWSDIGIGVIVSAAVALVGAVIGGIRGEQWHGRLVNAAVQRQEAKHRPQHLLGTDPTTTTVDLAAAEGEGELSVEEERERSRTGRSDVGL